jgi:hypothetical protein
MRARTLPPMAQRMVLPRRRPYVPIWRAEAGGTSALAGARAILAGADSA